MGDASEESMNHGTRGDKEEEDKYRTEHLVAVCRNMMCMDMDSVLLALNALEYFSFKPVERLIIRVTRMRMT